MSTFQFQHVYILYVRICIYIICNLWDKQQKHETDQLSDIVHWPAHSTTRFGQQRQNRILRAIVCHLTEKQDDHGHILRWVQTSSNKLSKNLWVTWALEQLFASHALRTPQQQLVAQRNPASEISLMMHIAFRRLAISGAVNNLGQERQRCTHSIAQSVALIFISLQHLVVNWKNRAALFTWNACLVFWPKSQHRLRCV